MLYKDANNRVTAVSYTAKGDVFTIGAKRLWWDGEVMTLSTMFTWNLAPDGKRMVALLPPLLAGQKPVTHLTFLLNFFDELQRRAAGGPR